jgi:hypothetical protein
MPWGAPYCCLRGQIRGRDKLAQLEFAGPIGLKKSEALASTRHQPCATASVEDMAYSLMLAHGVIVGAVPPRRDHPCSRRQACQLEGVFRYVGHRAGARPSSPAERRQVSRRLAVSAAGLKSALHPLAYRRRVSHYSRRWAHKSHAMMVDCAPKQEDQL